MKTNFIYLTVLLFTLLSYMACEKDSTDSEITSVDVEAIKTVVINGVWKVTYYFDEKDETSDFSSFSFDFKVDGVLIAESNDSAISGFWSIDVDSSSSDDSSYGVDFDIFLGNSQLLEELNEDWDIIKYSENKIELKDISGSDDSVDYLTFEKVL